MTDYSELKRLAEAATPGPWQTEQAYPIVQPAYPSRGAICSALIWSDASFIAAANPAVVLELIAEVERISLDNSSLRGSCARLGAEHAAMARNFKKANRMQFDARTERDQLKTENDFLRKIISDSATSCGAAVSVECSLDFMAHLPAEIFSVISKLRNALTDCSDSLHSEMLGKFGGEMPDDMHPVTRRDYDRDMAEVAGYRAALRGVEVGLDTPVEAQS